MKRLLIVGLGNYTFPNTRHSVGQMFVDYFRTGHPTSQWILDSSVGGWISSYTSSISRQRENVTVEVALFKPREFMNESGRSVGKMVRKLDLRRNGPGWENNVLIVHDEMERELGKVSMKTGGASGGHNGIKSVIGHLGLDSFPRLRIGISRPPLNSPSDVSSYVLAKFSRKELEVLDETVWPKAEAEVEKWISGRV
ncbi:peptidyl-tRNA hydrolase [Gonapodya prolifera JEL478]|uniref:Peptidyl-tRNA hydrolase n=1 Tax=Gonapodya prolifera (strain JEL478) TaxID=1344416 RepID=A0A139ADA6_GONPJ|nr:peptidyl-tRNA hydrolase [Gonapodya prolifera JEL478]|eukprot:KXS14425.1 peptidyl-tRNA hydrolase [Gonapodya prolifera JEL478]